MIVAGTGTRVVVATRPVDFRKGHDGLAAVVEHDRVLGKDNTPDAHKVSRRLFDEVRNAPRPAAPAPSNSIG